MQEFHQLEANAQVKQFLEETRQCLHNMLRCVNIKEDVLVMLQLVGDLTFAWELIDKCVPYLKNSILYPCAE